LSFIVTTKQTPIPVTGELRRLGEHVAIWRKLMRLTSAELADRAGISRATLRAIEHGTGSASTENLLRVLRVIGVLEPVVSAADPYSTDLGRLRQGELLPQRVRRSQ
jgi:transcriptional regulator with XRE-family HTH domain